MKIEILPETSIKGQIHINLNYKAAKKEIDLQEKCVEKVTILSLLSQEQKKECESLMEKVNAWHDKGLQKSLELEPSSERIRRVLIE